MVNKLAWRGNKHAEFVEFLVSFIDELNSIAAEGAVVLVEGQRDRRALLDLGYSGRVVTKASLTPARIDTSLQGAKSVIILTDMDKEGRKLASTYVGLFRPMGVKTSLIERRRLKHASHGVFLHIENLSRFAPDVQELRSLRTKMRV